ncbi:NAD-dependent formate dehydrogenase alpha subunit [Dehalogenimonas sp. WBC-2]|nr:NAD-dependent formate dehydrogenase alpha subunit [Dehalogenimonas sp. WBC-2]
MAGLATTFGSGAMTNSIDDLDNARCFLAIGTNTTEAHPVLAMKLRQTVRKGAKLIVINPMKVDLVREADLWLRPRSGTDVALLMGMMSVIVNEGMLDTDFINQRCENFADFKEKLKDYPLDLVGEITGVEPALIVEASLMYASNKPATILYAMGLCEHSHGTDNVIATANLAMLTGNIGKPGSGVNPLRGQNNVQGACDMGCLPDLFPGYQPVNDESARKKFESAWGATLTPAPGMKLTEMTPAAMQGEIKALYISGENPVLTDPDSAHVIEALNKLDFFVFQDIFLNETAQLADVVFPACCFAEKDGTFTNTERRVQRIRKAVEPPGICKPDWWIVAQIASRMGAEGFEYDDASQIMDELASLTPSYGGINYRRLDNGSLQWPCTSEDHPGTCILHSEIFSRGKGHFVPLQYRPPAEMPDQDYPLMLMTGRRLYHYHATMTRKVKGLNTLMSEELVQVNPRDAEMLNIVDGEMVRVSSRLAELKVRAKITDAVPIGVVAMSFHFAECPTNTLISANPQSLDPVTKTPAYKTCPVKITKNS